MASKKNKPIRKCLQFKTTNAHPQHEGQENKQISPLRPYLRRYSRRIPVYMTSCDLLNFIFIYMYYVFKTVFSILPVLQILAS